MRDDLLDAYAAVDWAEAQIVRLGSQLSALRRGGLYELVTEKDAKPGYELVKFRKMADLPPVINVEVGAIINVIRSSLDILACTLAKRNGCIDPKDVYFPIVGGPAKFVRLKDGRIEKIKRLSGADQATIEGLKPYKGGDDLLYTIHELDKMRKHRRLITVSCVLRNARVTSKVGIPVEYLTTPGELKDGTPLCRFPSNSNAKPTVLFDITFDEAMYAKRESVQASLIFFASRAREIVALFDRP